MWWVFYGVAIKLNQALHELSTMQFQSFKAFETETFINAHLSTRVLHV